jgi:alkyldihydroxyacetonephosphate synthase
MTNTAHLWGWLGQGDSDPLAGKPMAEDFLRDLLGLERLEATMPLPFDRTKVRPSRLTRKVRSALKERFGEEGFREDPLLRAHKSLGQSYPDQIRRRSRLIDNPVDAVVRCASLADALSLLQLAAEFGFRVTVTGGATNVTAALQPSPDRRALVAADMTRMDKVLDISVSDRTVTAEAGILLPDLEAALGAKGLTLGHFPQSFHGATLGGSIACNGAGQRSDGYGRIAENMISAVVATPSGEWRTEPFRHAAEGPWLGGLLPGSEGLLGLICAVTLKVFPKPEVIEDRAYFMPNFEAGTEAVRLLAQRGHDFSMLRLSDAAETAFLTDFRLAMSGRSRATLLQRTVLRLKSAPKNPSLLLAGFEGAWVERGEAFGELNGVARRLGGVALGTRPGASWRKGRYDLPYLRESLMRRGIGVDTFETFVPWSALAVLKTRVEATLKEITASTLGAKSGHPIVLCHLSHSYPEGACLYFTLIFPRDENALQQWRIIKSSVNAEIMACGGAASHHHGVGADHADAAAAHKGGLGRRLLAALKAELDPDNILSGGMERILPHGKIKAEFGQRPS